MNHPEQEQELASKIVQHLTTGLGTIEHGSASAAAIGAQGGTRSKYREAPQPVFGLAWAGEGAFGVSASRYFNARNLIAVAAARA